MLKITDGQYDHHDNVYLKKRIEREERASENTSRTKDRVSSLFQKGPRSRPVAFRRDTIVFLSPLFFEKEEATYFSLFLTKYILSPSVSIASRSVIHAAVVAHRLH